MSAEEKDWKDVARGLAGIEPGKPASFAIKREVVPIVFVPGVMGSRMETAKGKKVWDPDAKLFMLWNYGMIWVSAADKKEAVVGSTFDKDRLRVRLEDEKHNKKRFGPTEAKRGWGGVSWGTYGEVLQKMAEPKTWSPPLRAFFELPVYAFGYNWSASNVDSGKKLKEFIADVVKQHGEKATCEHVVLVTHSMGGLVARAACEAGAASQVLGVIHGVQPVDGAVAAYWRMKSGFERHGVIDPAAWVLGSNGKEVTALLGNIPGPLQLLPSANYTVDGSETKWLKLVDASGKVLSALPNGDPYEEIYKDDDPRHFQRLVRKEFLMPEKNPDIDLSDAWAECKKKLDKAKAFHEKHGRAHHPETQVFYGSGGKKTAVHAVYKLPKYGWQEMYGESVMIPLQAKRSSATFDAGGVTSYLGHELGAHSEESKGGAFQVRFLTKGGVEFKVELEDADGPGDGTVPESSGSALEQTGDAPPAPEPRGFPDIDHEPAFQSEQRAGFPGDTTVDFTIAAIENLCRLKIKKAVG